MHIRWRVLPLLGGLIAGPFLFALAAEGATEASSPTAVWSWDATAGFDSYLHTYALATDDTTETISEYLVQLGLEGRSDRRSQNRWRLRAEASLGTELARERLEGLYRRVDADQVTRVRAIGRLWARQFRQTTDYIRSSDNVEGRGELGWTSWAGREVEAGIMGWGAFSSYRTPSTLELDHREAGAGLAARSRGFDGPQWSLSVRRAARAYPDSGSIDRRVWSLIGDFERGSWRGASWRVYHRSERRHVRDAATRPHAWIHGTDGQVSVPASTGQVLLELRSELWRYSQETEVYLDSWRLDSFMGYGWGDLLATRWRLGLTAERFDTGSTPETYAQFGIRAGAEAYGGPVSGSLTLEYGRRIYADNVGSAPVTPTLLPAEEATPLYSDFHYWKIWLMGSWSVDSRLSIEAMANYEPESHTEPTDDAALGFLSLRLVWRP